MARSFQFDDAARIIARSPEHMPYAPLATPVAEHRHQNKSLEFAAQMVDTNG
jgi:hypothetical protein